MRDYARMTAVQRAAYNEALLDAIDRLTQAAASADTNEGRVVAASFRLAAAELRLFRTEQIMAEPQLAASEAEKFGMERTG